MRNLKKTALALLLILLVFKLTGCNTMYGLGEDIEETGRAIQNASDH